MCVCGMFVGTNNLYTQRHCEDSPPVRVTRWDKCETCGVCGLELERVNTVQFPQRCGVCPRGGERKGWLVCVFINGQGGSCACVSGLVFDDDVPVSGSVL